jgi:porphobilinogen deaminase
VVENNDMKLVRDENGLALVADGQTLRGDFTKMIPRVKQGAISKELLARAAKIKDADKPLVAIDATAGLGEDSLILAAAGLKRLGLEHRISRYFGPDEMIPAACQGILGIQTRADFDTSITDKLNDRSSKYCAIAERAYVKAIGADCGSPDTAHAETDGSRMKITGLRYDAGRDLILRDCISGNASDAEALGRELARRMLEKE